MKTILIFDGNNAAYRTTVIGDFRTSRGVGIAVPYGLLGNTLYALKVFDTKYFVYTWDLGRNYARLALDKNYKANRRKKRTPEEQAKKDEFYKQMKLAQKIFTFLKIPQIKMTCCEADDLISYLSSFLSKKFKVIIVSSDRDLYQCITDRIHVYNPITKVVYDERAVYKKYGVTPKQFVFARSIIGDKSDNIKGIKGVGEKTAFAIVKSLPKLYIADLIKFLTEDRIFGKRKIASKILSNVARIHLNRQLMKLPKTIDDFVDASTKNTVRSYFNREFLSSIFDVKIINRAKFFRLMSILEFRNIKAEDLKIMNAKLR